MSGQTNCPCISLPSTVFVFNSVQVQLAANNVYSFKKAYDAAQVAAGSKTVYQFKTDRERMQYLIGQQAVLCNPPTVVE
jgi:hypothetical protein